MATTEQKEITLVDIFEKVKAWFAWLWKKWLLILIVGILGGALGLLYAFCQTNLYRKPYVCAIVQFQLREPGKLCRAVWHQSRYE